MVLARKLFGEPLRLWHRWHRAALNHAKALKRLRTPPIGLSLIFLLFHFAFVWLWFRHAGSLWGVPWAISSLKFYLVLLVTVVATLACVCKFCRVSKAALGIRPAHLLADFRWSIRYCLLGAACIGAVIATGFIAAWWLGVRLPAPPPLFVQLLGGSWTLPHFATLVGLGVSAILLAPLVEELIYRSFLLPVLTRQFGLFLAVAFTSLAFGFVHVVPFGAVQIPVLEIVGGLIMAAGFAIRWSVIPAMVIHAMGNLFAGILCIVYVRLFELYPALFLSQ